MRASTSWSSVLLVVGLVGMIVGAIDPLEGSLLITPAAAVATGGAFLAKTRYLRLMAAAFLLIAAGTAALFILSAFGGVGGPGGRSYWWATVIAPYPIGWVIGLVAAVLSLKERRSSPSA